ncbi:hypothetical protein XI09_42175 [Bradyrhizobium sp. CCBAU 11386]|nr:hypothetical protein [Bradyrhizobium sp. CCBAU 11386]
MEVHRSSALSLIRRGAIELLRLRCFDGLYFDRDNILERYAHRYAVNDIPHDFSGARLEAIIETQGRLVLGEYADNSARLLCIDATKCVVIKLYCDAPHVRHIHAIHMSEAERCIFVTTGDGSKFLDKWEFSSGELVFIARIKKHLAGHTAAINANGKDYFGTDFSSRPNYLERLDGKRFFFPTLAYKMAVLHMSLLNERYIVCLSGEHRPLGKRCAVSIFDSMREIFIHCDYIEPYDSGN